MENNITAVIILGKWNDTSILTFLFLIFFQNCEIFAQHSTCSILHLLKFDLKQFDVFIDQTQTPSKITTTISTISMTTHLLIT